MKTYYGYWSNGNTSNREPYTDTNKKRLAKRMREIVQGNDTGNGGWWRVLDEAGEQGEKGNVCPVVEGRI